MCIIAYSPAGYGLPSEERMKNMFWSNSDGAGFMFIGDNGRVVIKKGYMNLLDFLEGISESIKDPITTPVVMHFRIGTQGENDKTMTHPFPVTSDDSVLKNEHVFANIGVAHNGIISLTSKWGDQKKKEPCSDTFYFIRDYASLILNDVGYHNDRKKLILLERLADSKLCILGMDGHVEMIGTFISDEHDGCFYSNSSYLSGYSLYYGTRGSNSYTSGWLDEDDYSGYGLDGLSKQYQLSAAPDYHDDEKKSHPGCVHIKAAFVPEDYFILDETTGSMIGADYDMFLYDTIGRVFIYDNDNDYCVRLEDHSVIDADWDYKSAEVVEVYGFWQKVSWSLDKDINDISEPPF